MLLQVLLLVGGFFILIKGADFFVDGASSTADNFRVPKILIGLTIIAFGTSLPEFAVSVKSVLTENYDIVLGNVIGSNIMNILLILGVSALFNPLMVKKNTIKKELPIVLLLTIVFAILLSDSIFDSSVANDFTRTDGIVILLFFLVFIYYLISLVINRKDNEIEKIKKMPLGKAITLVVIGIGMITLGSHFVVDSAENIALQLGISEKLIGLTIVALGTSLPELVTSVVATKKGETDLAIGNVVGSNVFNIGLVAGLPFALFGGSNHISFNNIDLFVMLLSAILLFIFSINDRKITKYEGILFLLIFVIYYGYVIFRFFVK